MKQTSFLVEVVVKDDVPTIIVRSQNGAIVKITNSTAELSSFLDEIVESFVKPSTN